MQLITKLLISVFLMINIHGSEQVSDWKVERLESGEYQISSGSYRVVLDQTNIVPKVDKVETYGNLLVVSYHASTNGTSTMVDLYDGAVFDTNTKVLKGVHPYRYESLSANLNQADIKQPVWSAQDGQLVIEDKESGYKKTIPMN